MAFIGVNPNNYQSTKRFLPPKEYCRTHSSWVSLKLDLDVNDASPDCDTLKVMTYNIWYVDNHREIRYRYIIDTMLPEYDCDIVCLQEVSPAFLSLLLVSEYVRDSYLLSTSTNDTIFPYGVLILVNKRWKCQFTRGFFLCSLPTSMGRSALFAVFKNFTIATVHLDSLYCREERSLQLQIIARFLNQFKASILVGDMNFDDCKSFDTKDTRPLENNIFTDDPVVNNLLDIWPMLMPSDPGKTFDPSANQMIKQRPASHCMRYDRVLVQKNQDILTPVSIEMIGLRNIRTSEQPIFPSDHFGLTAVFKYHHTN